MKYLLLILCLSMIGFSQIVFAEEPITITYSDYTDEIVFDGKWTFTTEWKEGSLNAWRLNDGSDIVVRTVHDRDFIYILVDYLSDVFPEKNSDNATVCIGDSNRDKTPNEEYFCFIATVGNKNPVILQGGSPIAIYGNFEKISNKDVIAIGSISDKADRYIAIPHASYEFKIPVELVNRSDEYSFYVSVYDHHRDIVNSWPRDAVIENTLKIPSPQYWGIMYSPDKTLPEFNMPVLVMLMIFTVVICATRYNKLVSFYQNN